MTKNILKPIILALILLSGAFSLSAATHDTSYVCSGTKVVLTAQTTTGYTFHWLDENNNPVGPLNSSTYTVTGTSVSTATPIKLVYKLVVDSLGGATCSSDTFFKVIYALPAFTVTVDTGATFFCVGNIPTNVVLASNVIANGAPGAPNLASIPAYVTLNYAWVNTAPSPAGTPGGTPVGQTYTIPGSALITAGPGTYPYSNTVNYNFGSSSYVLGVGASATGTCAVTQNANVHITPQPSIQNVNVQTTYQ